MGCWGFRSIGLGFWGLKGAHRESCAKHFGKHTSSQLHPWLSGAWDYVSHMLVDTNEIRYRVPCRKYRAICTNLHLIRPLHYFRAGAGHSDSTADSSSPANALTLEWSCTGWSSKIRIAYTHTRPAQIHLRSFDTRRLQP